MNKFWQEYFGICCLIATLKLVMFHKSTSFTIICLHLIPNFTCQSEYMVYNCMPETQLLAVATLKNIGVGGNDR